MTHFTAFLMGVIVATTLTALAGDYGESSYGALKNFELEHGPLESFGYEPVKPYSQDTGIPGLDNPC